MNLEIIELIHSLLWICQPTWLIYNDLLSSIDKTADPFCATKLEPYPVKIIFSKFPLWYSKQEFSSVDKIWTADQNT